MSLFRFPEQRPSAPYQLMNDDWLKLWFKEYGKICNYLNEQPIGNKELSCSIDTYGIGVILAHYLGKLLSIYDLVGLMNNYKKGFVFLGNNRFYIEFPSSKIRDAVRNWNHGVNYYKVNKYMELEYGSEWDPNPTSKYIQEGRETLGIPVRAQVFM